MNPSKLLVLSTILLLLSVLYIVMCYVSGCVKGGRHGIFSKAFRAHKERTRHAHCQHTYPQCWGGRKALQGLHGDTRYLPRCIARVCRIALLLKSCEALTTTVGCHTINNVLEVFGFGFGWHHHRCTNEIACFQVDFLRFCTAYCSCRRHASSMKMHHGQEARSSSQHRNTRHPLSNSELGRAVGSTTAQQAYASSE